MVFFVASAAFGDIAVSLFVVGATFGEIWVDSRNIKYLLIENPSPKRAK